MQCDEMYEYDYNCNITLISRVISPYSTISTPYSSPYPTPYDSWGQIIHYNWEPVYQYNTNTYYYLRSPNAPSTERKPVIVAPRIPTRTDHP